MSRLPQAPAGATAATGAHRAADPPLMCLQKALRPDMGYNTLANFRIEKKIGRGQFSEVYRAACLLDGVPVALKKVQVGWLPPRPAHEGVPSVARGRAVGSMPQPVSP